MALILGYIIVGFTVYRIVSYQIQQRSHAAVASPALSVSDAISSRLFEFLYAAAYCAAAYGVFISDTGTGFIIAGFICMMMSWRLRQVALKDLGRNYGHEITLFKDHQLVRSGVYRSMRHPLYLGLSIDIFGASLIAQNMFGWIVCVLFVAVALRRTHLEDSALRARFGDEAKLYQQQVPAVSFWPGFYKR